MTVDKFSLSDVDVNMTDRAVAHFQHQLQDKAQCAVRLWVKESGCSGYMYEIDFVDSPQADDNTYQFADVTLHVAKAALPMLQGTEIDLVTEGVNKTIQFNNPNAKAMCGCGESFTLS